MPIEYEVIITIDNKQEIQTAFNLESAYVLFDAAVSAPHGSWFFSRPSSHIWIELAWFDVSGKKTVLDSSLPCDSLTFAR